MGNMLTAMIVTVVLALFYAAVRYIGTKHSSNGSCGGDGCSSCGGCDVHFYNEIKADQKGKDSNSLNQ